MVETDVLGLGTVLQPVSHPIIPVYSMVDTYEMGIFRYMQ